MLVVLSEDVVEEKWLERVLARDAAILLTCLVGLLFPRAGSMRVVSSLVDGTCAGGDKGSSNGRRRATAGALVYAAKERRNGSIKYAGNCVG